ncbi:hypothetical protein FLONG3_7497 [Fusarium longipes]|uniref:Uncharacterized protein n=1 Tax=Fusarium longipes TaxID=694270 RepID=A0A395SE28_9HYPO|nr:hypothetical protein FLONG3_7497 [Fusarium longipes]
MASRRSQFVGATEAPPGLYYQDPRYIYHAPQTPLRTIPLAPIRLAEDYYNQMYPVPATPATPYIFPTCCRGRSHSRRRRASHPTKAYDNDDSTDTYSSYEDEQRVQQAADCLPPRIALKQLSDFLYDASVFYSTQLVEFTRKHQASGHDTSNEAFRQWLWSDWVNRCDDTTREYFASTKTNTTLLLRQVEMAVATPWLEDAHLVARFDYSFKILKDMCDEIIRLASKATSDWRACRFLAVEMKSARLYANPEGLIQHHLFNEGNKGELW